MDSYLQLRGIPVLRVRADMKGAGPSKAFDTLESKLPTLKGRKFYGSFQLTPDGELYYACVERIATDEPTRMDLEVGAIPGGWYVRRKLVDWESKLSELSKIFAELAEAHAADATRPSLEFYRSHTELHLLMPVQTPTTPVPATGAP